MIKIIFLNPGISINGIIFPSNSLSFENNAGNIVIKLINGSKQLFSDNYSNFLDSSDQLYADADSLMIDLIQNNSTSGGGGGGGGGGTDPADKTRITNLENSRALISSLNTEISNRQAGDNSLQSSKQDNLGFTPENVSNKSTDIDTDKLSTTKYAAVKAIFNWATNLFIAKKTAITAATKTKIQYDSNGLIINGTDATTADIAPSTDRNYNTDAKQIVIGNTSGINSGDQTATTTPFTSNGDISSTNTQAAIVELRDDTDTKLSGKQNSLGFTPENTANKGVANGYIPSNALNQIDSQYLPSYVDDILEFVNLAAFPAIGEVGKIFIAIDTGKQYRWTGSVYFPITNGFIASTNDVAEGSTNKYWTLARTIGSVLTDWVVAATYSTISTTDTISEAFGKIQKKLNDLGGASLLNVGTSTGTVADGGNPIPNGSTAGTDTYTTTLSPAPTSYVANAIYSINFINANLTITPNNNINSLGTKTIVNHNGSAIPIGGLSGELFLKYDSTLDKLKVIGRLLPNNYSADAAITGAVALNLNGVGTAHRTLSGNTTITISGMVNGDEKTVVIKQHASVAYTVTWANAGFQYDIAKVQTTQFGKKDWYTLKMAEGVISIFQNSWTS